MTSYILRLFYLSDFPWGQENFTHKSCDLLWNPTLYVYKTLACIWMQTISSEYRVYIMNSQILTSTLLPDPTSSPLVSPVASIFRKSVLLPSGDGNGNPLQYSCLENPMDRGAWQGYSPWGHKSQTPLSDWTTTSIIATYVQDTLISMTTAIT